MLGGINQEIRGLVLSVPHPNLWRVNQSPMANDVSKHAYLMRPLSKPKRTRLESFQVGEHLEAGASGMRGKD